MKLYSDNFVDIVFGEGPLGFRIGESEDGNAIVAAFTEREGEDPFPLQLSAIIDVNYYIISLNSLNVIDFYKDEVKKLIRNGKRPLKVRFAKPIDSRVNLYLSQPWDESDGYLPIRRYDFSQFSKDAKFCSRANFSLQDRALVPFYPGGELFLCDLRNFVYKGVSDPLVRANCWKVLLKVYPLTPHRWASKQQENIHAYREFVKEFIVSQNALCGCADCTLVPSPIDTTWKKECDYQENENNESEWSRAFGDNDIREIIWKDVERTYSDLDFFHKHNMQVMARMLFIFCKLNSSVLYVQGMNELLAPLLFAFAEGVSELDQEVSEGVEADTFFAFSNLMSEMRDLFLRQMDKTTSGIGGVLRKVGDCIQRIMPNVWERMSQMMVEPQFFAVRWITTLYSREFEMKETLRVWDSILADPRRFMLSYCLGVALLWNIEHELEECDFAQFIQKLQNYQMPNTEDILALANRVRLQELLYSYEQNHPGYSKRMSRAGHEMAEALSPRRTSRKPTFTFKHIGKSRPASPQSPRMSFFIDEVEDLNSVSEPKSPCIVYSCLFQTIVMQF